MPNTLLYMSTRTGGTSRSRDSAYIGVRSRRLISGGGVAFGDSQGSRFRDKRAEN